MTTRRQYLAARKAEQKHLAHIPKPKFKVGDMVYSWQNPDVKAEVNRVRPSEEVGFSATYRLTLGYDPYPVNSKWMNEESLSKTRLKCTCKR